MDRGSALVAVFWIMAVLSLAVFAAVSLAAIAGDAEASKRKAGVAELLGKAKAAGEDIQPLLDAVADLGDRLKRPLRPWLRYEYEIIHSIEAGDVGLTLPGGQLLDHGSAGGT